MKFDQIPMPPQLLGHVWRHELTARRWEALPAHAHQELEFNLAVSGRGTYIIDERRYVLRPGTLLWLFPEQVHILVERSEDFAMWIAVFTPAMLDQLCRQPASRALRAARPRGLFCKQLAMGAAERLGEQCEQLVGIEDEPDRYNAGLGHLLFEAWAAFEGAEQLADPDDVHPAVERAAHMLRHASEPVKMEDVAHEAGLSLSHLSRLFRQQVGTSMVAFRQRCCIEQFFSRYGQGRRLNMTEAALQSGFGSYVHFHRVFRKVMGVGPAEHFRRQRTAE